MDGDDMDGRDDDKVLGVLTGQVQMHTPEAALDFPECDNHIEIQHRDNLPPWCHTCGWNRGRPVSVPRKVKNV